MLACPSKTSAAVVSLVAVPPESEPPTEVASPSPLGTTERIVRHHCHVIFSARLSSGYMTKFGCHSGRSNTAAMAPSVPAQLAPDVWASAPVDVVSVPAGLTSRFPVRVGSQIHQPRYSFDPRCACARCLMLTMPVVATESTVKAIPMPVCSTNSVKIALAAGILRLPRERYGVKTATILSHRPTPFAALQPTM